MQARWGLLLPGPLGCQRSSMHAMRETRGQQPGRLQLVLKLYSSSDSAGGARPGRCGAAACAGGALPAPGRAPSAMDTGWHMINAVAARCILQACRCRRRLLPRKLAAVFAAAARPHRCPSTPLHSVHTWWQSSSSKRRGAHHTSAAGQEAPGPAAMAEGGKSHRKKKAGRKAEKRKAAEGKKKGGGDGDMGGASTRAALSADQVR